MTLAAELPIGVRFEVPTMADAPAMNAFERECWAEEVVAGGLMSNRQARTFYDTHYPLNYYSEMLEDRLANPFALLQVVRQDGREVFGTFDGDYAGGSVLNNSLNVMYLDKMLRGRKIGSQLLANFEEKLKNDAPIWLQVMTHNTNAQGFYRSQGFDMMNGRPIIGEFFETHVMIKHRKVEVAA